MNLENKKFVMENGQEYLTIESVEYGGKCYTFIINKTNPLDSLYVEVFLTVI